MSNENSEGTIRPTGTIPRIDTWVEGLLDYFNAKVPSNLPELRQFGFNTGKQVIGLYIIEVLLKYTREQKRRPYRQDHNLRKLFQGLPPRDRKKVENKYRDIVRSSSGWALDIEKSVLDLLSYLGHNPITSTRYFWERSHPSTSSMSILVAPHMLTPVIFAILIRLHGYPDRTGRKRHLPKTFVPRHKWVQRNKKGKAETSTNTKKKLDKDWMMGLRFYFGAQSPRTQGDRRRLGFALGSQIAGLYLAEIALKYALDERSIEYEEDHNLEGLFLLLPGREKERLRTSYKKILHSERGHAWDFQRSLEELLRYLDKDPFTVSRYFWDEKVDERDGVLFSPRMLAPLIDSVLSDLHGFEIGPKDNRFFERDFQSFEESIRNMGPIVQIG